jgi:hypothetical protein
MAFAAQLKEWFRGGFPMPPANEFPVSTDEELQLHGRLVKGDPTAPADLASSFLDRLVAWLAARNSSDIPEELRIEAAEDALIALAKSPLSFKPERRMRLYAYLRMSAQGDLRNILRREGRQRQHEISLQDVELSKEAGKYLAEDGDQLRLLEIKEEGERARLQVVSPARDGLTGAESRALDLLLQGERKTAVFAEVLGITDWAKRAQQAEVKRVKDKLKKRLQRETSGDGQAS